MKLDVVYTCLNTVLEFCFTAMKADSQLANLLVKTTKLMPSVFAILKQTLVKQQCQGYILICIDKCVKVMHLALLHPRDHTL